MNWLFGFWLVDWIVHGWLGRIILIIQWYLDYDILGIKFVTP